MLVFRKILASRWQRFLAARRARKMIREMFDDGEILKGTSLRRAHRSRVDLFDFEMRDGDLTRIGFTILRHPRPYAFSSQHHEVVELYRYEPKQRRLRREKSLNLSRVKGRDGEPAGRGGF